MSLVKFFLEQTKNKVSKTLGLDMYILGTCILIYFLFGVLRYSFRRMRKFLGPPLIKLKVTDLYDPKPDSYQPASSYWLYLIRCDHKKYYVGITRNLKRRRCEEWSLGNRCPKWLKLHPPREYVGVFQLRTTNKKRAEKIETKFTKDLWIVYGQDNVRGGYYSAERLPRMVRRLSTKSR